MNSSTYFRDWLYRVYKPCAIVYSSEKIKKLFNKNNISPADFLRPLGDFKGRQITYPYNDKENCICNIPYNEVGSCSRIYDDNYNPDKFCYGNNIIYFWKGKRYISLKTEVYTYYKNAKLKDEECPEGTKIVEL